ERLGGAEGRRRPGITQKGHVENPEDAVMAAALLAGTTRRCVADAMTLKHEAPSLYRLVRLGYTSIFKANREFREKKAYERWAEGAKKRSFIDEEETAYHEAGHAVVAYLLGYDVSSVTGGSEAPSVVFDLGAKRDQGQLD